jgi:hypothetical protein
MKEKVVGPEVGLYVLFLWPHVLFLMMVLYRVICMYMSGFKRELADAI